MSCACGPGWLPNEITHWYLKVPIGEKCFFHEACVQHDLDYENPSFTKEQADTKFLVSMMNAAVDSSASDEQIKQAISYYYWVKYGGHISYFLSQRAAKKRIS